MRRVAPPVIVIGVGLVILTDLVIANPTLDGLARFAAELLVLLAAAGAVAGALALVVRHGGDVVRRQGDPPASLALLVGLIAMPLIGLRPGADGAVDPAVGWLVSALVVPLGASLFALLFFFTLVAARGSLERRGREAAVMLGAAAVVLVLLLPVGGSLGALLGSIAEWTLAVPIGGVFRGLLIGIAVATAVAAARLVLGVDGADD